MNHGSTAGAPVDANAFADAWARIKRARQHIGQDIALFVVRAYLTALREHLRVGREHLTIGGTFQSDKYPTCPAGKVPLSVNDPMAQDLLRIYADRRQRVDAEFTRDLHEALDNAGAP